MNYSLHLMIYLQREESFLKLHIANGERELMGAEALRGLFPSACDSRRDSKGALTGLKALSVLSKGTVL